jgi:UDP-N-acetylmuramoylalanine--D-glutamate ligase
VIPVYTYSGQHVAVYGLGRTGMSAIRSLVAGGASVVAWDDSDAACEAGRDAGALIMHPSGWNWLSLAGLVLSPGVPLTHPEPHGVVGMAQGAGVEILGDTELFARAIAESDTEARVVVVTGTNGKSTTTALITHLLNHAGIPAQMGGNIGIPVLDLDPPSDASVYVLEISSYQADLTHTIAPDVAVLLNITPDHLERHGGFEGYVASKRRLVNMVRSKGKIVLGVDSLQTQEICTEMTNTENGRLLPVSVGKVIGFGLFVVNGVLWDGTGSLSQEIMTLSGLPTLPGAHNWENAAAAFACCKSLGVETSKLIDGLSSFPGLPHRQEILGKRNGVLYINDSKATNSEAAAKALECYENIYWIAGGRLKEGGVQPLKPLMRNVRKAYLIGEAASEIRETLDGDVEIDVCEIMERAVDASTKDALKDGLSDPVILLSPACASFDQFPDFEQRGDAFRKIVEALNDGPAITANGSTDL